MRRSLTAASFGMALAAAVFLLFWPVYSGSDGVHATRATLVEINGPWAVVPVALPVLFALAPLIFTRQAVRITATVLLGAFTLTSGFTIGLFYLPAALAMLAACLAPRPSAQR